MKPFPMVPSRTNSRRGMIAAAASLLALAVPLVARAQAYPSRPVTLVVAQAAGSATDILARVYGQKLGEMMGTSVVVENRPGAGGLLGTEVVARAAPDGYTLLVASVSTHGVNPVLYKSKKYDPIADFTPIGLTATTANVVAVSAASPIKSVKALMDAAKAAPGMQTYASSGNGSSQHLGGEYLVARAGGLKVVHVPYKGVSPGLTALIAGEVDWMMPAAPSSMPFIKQGKLRALAVTSAKPLPELPGVPTVAETYPGFEVITWYGLVGPARLPAEVVQRLAAANEKALTDAGLREKLLASGLVASASTPEQFATYIRAEMEKWKKVAGDSQISLD